MRIGSKQARKSQSESKSKTISLPLLQGIRAGWPCIAIALVLVTSGSTAAAATLTTANLLSAGRPQASWAFGNTNESSTNFKLAQSFTTSVGGSVDSVSVDIFRTEGVDDLTLSIYTALGDVPDTLLGSVTEPKESFPSGSNVTTTIDFSGLGILLSPSTKYVLVASVINPQSTEFYQWSSTTDSGYAGGVPSFNHGGVGDPWEPLFPHNDFVFGVYVNPVPIPPTMWLMGSALGLLGWLRRRHS